MARIFVSYARSDVQLAEQVADLLERDGHSVFYDVRIESGTEFASEIQRQLRQADFVVALFSDAYRSSRVSRYEAIVGFEAGKLVPIGFGEFRADMERPFGALQFIDGNSARWKEELRRAVGRRPDDPSSRERVIASEGPHQRPPKFGRLARQELRLQLLAWLSVGGATLTLAGNLDAFLVFAGWIEWINTHWSAMITWFWNFVVPFDIRIVAEDAVIFTFLAMLFLNLLLTSSDRERNVEVHVRDAMHLVLVTGIAAYIAFIGFIHEVDSMEVGVTDLVMDPIVAFTTSWAPAYLQNAIEFVAVTLAGSLILLILYFPISAFFAVRPNARAFGARLQNILIGLALITVANQVSLSLQSHEWQDLFRTAEAGTTSR